MSPGVTWTDGTTPVNAANLETMEADTAAAAAAAAAADTKATNAQTTANAAQPKAEKGQVNGYASLDAGGTVPDAQIPAAIARDAEVTSAISAHAAAADPHTGYQKETEKGAVSGYASLDGTGVVPDAQLPAALARDAEVAAAITAHVAAADPHTGYQQETEKGAASGYAPLDASSRIPDANLPQRIRAGGSGCPGNDANNALEQGWYAMSPTVTNSPGLWGGMLTTGLDGATSVRQTFYTHGTSAIWQRQLAGGSWSGWGMLLSDAGMIPAAVLPPVSGVDYIGTWGAGTAYKKGDVVRYGSNDYMAVNDSTGVTPPAAFVPPVYAPAYGTSLPASPVDGQEAILVDSLTAPTYSWRFRYSAGIADANKWVFIGGSSKMFTGATQTMTFTSSWVLVPTWTVAIPRAGQYVVEWNCQASAAPPAHISEMSIWVGTGIVGRACMWASAAFTGNTTSHYPWGRDTLTFNGGDVLGVVVNSSQGPTWTLAGFRLSLTPVKIS